jgi:hypothetical protein
VDCCTLTMKKLPPAGFVLTGSPNPGRISSAANSPWPPGAEQFLGFDYAQTATNLWVKLAYFGDINEDTIFCPFILTADHALLLSAKYGWAGFQSRDDSEIYLGDWVQASIIHQPLAVLDFAGWVAWLAAH